MRSFLLFAALSVVPCVTAFSFNAYDLGLHGFYPRQHFHSVDLEPPAPRITHWDSQCDSGNLLLTPRGPLVSGQARGPVMLDAKGDLIWMETDQFQQALNLNVQKYKGQDYLTFWTKTKKLKKTGQETNSKKHPKKSYVMLNSSYEVAHRVYPHGIGLKGDSHEFRITPQGTALITIYYKREANCTDLGLGKNCWIRDGVFQEVDIETGDLIFEWSATDHIRMTDVFSSPSRKDGHGKSKKDAFDFFHINSVDKTDSGDYIVSARYMHAVLCVSAKTGEVLWQLGGKNNDFEDLNRATDFAWQHHVTWQGNNTISVFDNHANNVFHSPSKHSKGMIIRLDMEKMTATLLQKYVHPDKILNVSQGSVQIIPESGNVLVGFGNSPTYVEYSADGRVLCAAHFGPHLIFEAIDFGFVKSYRVFKSPWVGRPMTVPDVKVKGRKVYVSWNGATEVSGWRLETTTTLEAKNDGEFVTAQELARDGFETSFTLDKINDYVRVVALNATNGVMAYSPVVSMAGPSFVSFWLILFLILGFLGFMTFAFLNPKVLRLPHLLRLPRLPRLPRLKRFPRLPLFSRIARIPRLPLLPKLSNLRARWNAPARNSEEHDYESEPLLLHETDR